MPTLTRNSLVGSVLWLAAATGTFAACFPVGKVPGRITYTDGAAHEIITSDGDSVTYNAFDKAGAYQNTATIISGMFLKAIAINGETVVRYTWDGALPTTKDMVVGAVFDVTGVEDSGSRHKVTMHIEVLGATTAKVAGCRYPALKLSYVFNVVGAHSSAGTRILDPATMQTYKADFTATNPDGSHTKFSPVVARLD